MASDTVLTPEQRSTRIEELKRKHQDHVDRGGVGHCWCGHCTRWAMEIKRLETQQEKRDGE